MNARSRSIVAASIALGLAVVLFAWFARRDRAVEQAPTIVQRVEASSPPQPQPEFTRDATESKREPTPLRASEIAEPLKVAPAPSATTEPVLCTVFGVVQPAEGAQLGDKVAVGFTDRLGRLERAYADGTGAYSISGLAPGHWWVSCGSKAASTRAQIELDANQPERRLDLTLVAAAEVRVKVTNASGEPISARGLLGVATLTTPGEWFGGVSGSWNNTFGVGAWQNRSVGKVLAAPYIGSIVLNVEPPVYVSLLRYQRVLATVRVETRDQDAEFLLDPNSPLLADATLRARAVDAATGAPIATVSSQLESSEVQGSESDTNSPGVCSFVELKPGHYELLLEARGYAESRSRLLIEPGAALDLGDIRMDPEQWIDGVVVDEAGMPLDIPVSCNALDRASGQVVRTMVGRGYKPEPNGHFRITGLARGEFVLGIIDRKSEFGLCAVLVDTRNGPVERLRLVAARGPALVLQPSRDGLERLRYTVRNADALAVFSARLQLVEPLALRVAPGAYTVEVEMPGGAAPLVHNVVLTDEPVELVLP